MQSGDWSFPHVQNIQEGILKWGVMGFLWFSVGSKLLLWADAVPGRGNKIPLYKKKRHHFYIIFFLMGPNM